MDREASGPDRTPLIKALLEADAAVVLDRDGAPAGFAMIRRFGLGQVIGPVVAPDEAGARALIGHFLTSNPANSFASTCRRSAASCPG